MEKCLKISQKLHGGDGRHIMVCNKTKIWNRQMSYFSPYANFNCPYLKIGLCDLFPALLECIIITGQYSYMPESQTHWGEYNEILNSPKTHFHIQVMTNGSLFCGCMAFRFTLILTVMTFVRCNTIISRTERIVDRILSMWITSGL